MDETEPSPQNRALLPTKRHCQGSLGAGPATLACPRHFSGPWERLSSGLSQARHYPDSL